MVLTGLSSVVSFSQENLCLVLFRLFIVHGVTACVDTRQLPTNAEVVETGLGAFCCYF